MPGEARVSREQVLAYRTARHNLAERQPATGLLAVTGASGLQNTPPGSAALALAARVEGISAADVMRALEEEKSLLQSWSLRGSPYVFPTDDAAAFTLGLRPDDEAGLRGFLPGATPLLDRVDLSATRTLDLLLAALPDALAGQALPITPLGVELAARIEPHLAKPQLAAWRAPSGLGPGQTTGEALAHFLLRAACLHGHVCFAARTGNKAPFALTREWLGHPLPAADPAEARADLLRRYLRCYAPATAAHYATWSGMSLRDVSRAWRPLEPSLACVRTGDGTAWILAEDLPALANATPARGTRLLPPKDPYLAQRDRSTLLPDTRQHRQVWQASGEPGAVTHDGQLVATWRPRTSGSKLSISVSPLEPVSEGTRARIREEAERLAAFRGHHLTGLDFAD